MMHIKAKPVALELGRRIFVVFLHYVVIEDEEESRW